MYRGAMYYEKKRKELIEIQDKVMVMEDVQPGYPTWSGYAKQGLPKKPGAQPGITWCNRGAERIARLAGADTKLILDSRGIGFTSANSMYKYAVESVGKKKIREVDEETAQKLSWNGMVILAAAKCIKGNLSGHVTILRPTLWGQDQLCANIGGTMGVMTVKKAFDVNYLSPIKYFLIPRRKEELKEA